jgi:hypothetical protein
MEPRDECLYDCPQLNKHCHGGHDEGNDEAAEEEHRIEEGDVEEEELVEGLLLGYPTPSHCSTGITGVGMSILGRFCEAL